jgi:hypothetical protein
MKLSKRTQIVLVMFVVGLLLVEVFTVAKYFPGGIDWSTAYRPAIWRILNGQALYSDAIDPKFMGFTPWALIPLIPLALLPEEVGRVFLLLLTIAAFIFTAKRLGASMFTTILVVLSPMAIHSMLNGNLDWLATLGFVFPPGIGVFFISTKPQIGIAVGIYWLIESLRSEGLRATIKTFSPFLAMVIVSMLIWGFWPGYLDSQLNFSWNSSLWPYSIPFGLLFLGLAIQKRHQNYAMVASPLLSPYVLFHSWIGVLMATVTSTRATLIAFVAAWVIVIYQLLG